MRLVARTRATVQGRTVLRAAVTAGCWIKFFSAIEISRIIMKAGRMTPKVARRAPRTPAWVAPTKVAMLTARGPGVDSATAMKSRN